MRRIPFLLLFVALTITGCSRFFIQKDAYATVKRAALVQYAINPHMLLGTPNADEAKFNTAAAAYDVLGKELSGSFQLMPLGEMLNNPGYAASGGHAPSDGFHTAKGAMFFSKDSRDIQSALISPESAKALCANLNVDAVIVVFDSWGIQQYAMGFRGQSSNSYAISMFDKNGVKIMSDALYANSEEGMSLTMGIVSTDVPSYVMNNTQAFTTAVRTLLGHINAK